MTTATYTDVSRPNGMETVAGETTIPSVGQWFKASNTLPSDGIPPSKQAGNGSSKRIPVQREIHQGVAIMNTA